MLPTIELDGHPVEFKPEVPLTKNVPNLSPYIFYQITSPIGNIKYSSIATPSYTFEYFKIKCTKDVLIKTTPQVKLPEIHINLNNPLKEKLPDDSIHTFPEKSFTFRFLNGSPYSIYLTAGTDYEYLNIHFNPDILVDLLYDYCFFSHFYVKVKENNSVTSYGKSPYKINAQSPMDLTLYNIFTLLHPLSLYKGRYEMNGNLLLIEALQAMYPNEVSRSTLPLPEFMEKAIRYVENNLWDKGRIETLAKKTFTNSFKLKHGFHTYLKKRPKQFVEETKVKAGLKLLLTTNMKLLEIAQILGYGDDGIFLRAFTRGLGYRPNQIRKALKNIQKTQLDPANVILSLCRDKPLSDFKTPTNDISEN